MRPFDNRKRSKVLHPSDWDPQADISPLDIDLEWAGIGSRPATPILKRILNHGETARRGL
jgi:hypothetical protein